MIHDVIIIGAGSIGLPTALDLAESGLKVLVIDSEHAPGQLSNKKAIGGVRATHSDFGKISIGRRTIEVFKNWQESRGDDIGWFSGGYSYPAYTKEDEKSLKELMKIQLDFGLNIKWLSPDEYAEIVPGISREGLLGSTYSPEDGSCSPLLFNSSIYRFAVKAGVEFRFGERLVEMKMNGDKISELITDKSRYQANIVINAAGSYAREVGAMVHEDLPVFPDNHEAGITEPVARFFEPMVVDMRKAPGSTNFYFYQNYEGQVLFCITPDPPILGVNNRSTSEFLPMCSKRMIDLYPRLRLLRVRRTWRGQYPMTPDGFPIVGHSQTAQNMLNVVGMCGQGFMFGPGMAELTTRMITDDLRDSDLDILKSFDPLRDFSSEEKFK